MFNLCSFDAISRDVRNADTDLDCLSPNLNLLDACDVGAGKGGKDPSIAPLLNEFCDVLRTEIPGGLLPERFRADGTRTEHTIGTAQDAVPYSRPPRPFTPEETAEIYRYVQDLLDKGWITPSLSPWAPPVLFIPKKRDPVTGVRTWRMCISYVKLNSKTLNRTAYRLPRIADLLARVSNAQYFSKLDLPSAFYQVRMRDSDIPKICFTTPCGNSEFKVMPMCLCGTPGKFQMLMDEAIAQPTPIRYISVSFQEFASIYLDDVCVFSRSFEEHLFHLRAVLSRLRERKLYVKPVKCEWAQTEIEFLGHRASPTGLSITHGKAEALQKWPVPTSVAEVRSVLGAFGFWRQYIRLYANSVEPLVVLTRKATPWGWGESEQPAFERLKYAVQDSPVLKHPDQDLPFIAVTDASDCAIGASREQTDARDGFVCSFRIDPAERKYPVHERDLLATVPALRTWRQFLLGSEFSVVCQTGHKPLQSFMTQPNL